MGKNAQEIISMNRECDIVLTGPEFDKLNQKGKNEIMQRWTFLERCYKNSQNSESLPLKH